MMNNRHGLRVASDPAQPAVIQRTTPTIIIIIIHLFANKKQRI